VVKLGKVAVESGMTVLCEIERGAFRLTARSRTLAQGGRRKPVAEYVKLQSRFAAITSGQIDELQGWVDRRWERCLERHRLSPETAEGKEREA
jgi:pyruvate ferredoxin oxidoreductase beta subunit